MAFERLLEDWGEQQGLIFIAEYRLDIATKDIRTVDGALVHELRVPFGAGPVDVPEAVGFVPRSELGGYYERAAVVCVPSRREGYGVVAREAMAYGRPVVATRVGGLADAIEDGVSGVLVDAPGLRPALERLLGDAALRQRLGASARALSQERSGRSREVAAILAAYRAS